MRELEHELFSAGGEDQAFANKGPDAFVIRRPSDVGVYEPYFLKDFIKVKLFFWVFVLKIRLQLGEVFEVFFR